MLPTIDEHSTVVAAPRDAVWAALGESLDGAFAVGLAPLYARAVGCEPATASGPRPLAAGSTIPGFAVERALPPSQLALAGRHRFSVYELRFRIDADGRRQSVLTAESRASFPGIGGAAYRALVISSGFHVLAVRRLLADVRRRAEAAT